MHADPPREESKEPIGFKLPRFSVPMFDGDILKLSNLWDRFLVSIYDKTELLDTEKLAYLRDVLKDGPVEEVNR